MRTRTFADIYPSATEFVGHYLDAVPSAFQASGTDPGYSVSSDDATFIYFLLYSRYANSHIASSDENRFRFQVSSLIFQYGPLWRKELDIQKYLRSLDHTNEALLYSSLAINNHAYNPSTGPSTTEATELDKIDE
jgi:hypothetical protein